MRNGVEKDRETHRETTCDSLANARSGVKRPNRMEIICWVAQLELEGSKLHGICRAWVRAKLNSNSPLLPVCMQSTPNLELFSLACRDLMLARVSMGLRPEFSASAIGTQSSASANERNAYCSRPGLCCCVRTYLVTTIPNRVASTLTAASSTASEQATSAAPPP